MNADDFDYFAERAEHERQAADTARDEAEARSRRALAEKYAAVAALKAQRFGKGG